MGVVVIGQVVVLVGVLLVAAAMGVQVLMDMLEHGQAPRHIVVSAALQKRESVGPVAPEA